VGNHHHAKLIGDDWVPMATRFQELGGIEPFCIDQLPTVNLDPSRSPANVPITHELRDHLLALGGTARFSRLDPRVACGCGRTGSMRGSTRSTTTPSTTYPRALDA
jgi:hypothetical protein